MKKREVSKEQTEDFNKIKEQIMNDMEDIFNKYSPAALCSIFSSYIASVCVSVSKVVTIDDAIDDLKWRYNKMIQNDIDEL